MSRRKRPTEGNDDKTRLFRPADAGSNKDFPERIGDYRLIRLLGEGGMGRVFLAEQLEPVQRKVALKLINGDPDDQRITAFFEAERQILARLHHPFIAQVYDAGTSRHGEAWFAMELVRGEPIIQHSRQAELDVEERLRLFMRVCRGVEHAHQRGVLHRDLKPANILVSRRDGKSLPKIIDFGIATHLQPGQRNKGDRTQVGTPAYMSPEQLGDRPAAVGLRSDVYALGVILFELLLDTRPPRGSAESELRQLCSSLQSRRTTTQSSQHASDASAASLESLVARARQLPYELRCILARALAVDPEERYQSVDALGTDLRQYLEHQPVSAVPQTRAYVWRKFLHRHRLAAAFVSLVSLSLIGGLTMALWGLFEARDQRDLARAESERTTMALEFVSSMLESIDPDFAQGGDTLLISRLLEDAAFRADRALRNHPDIEADIQLTLGQTYLAIGDFQLAGQHLERSRELAADTGLHGVALRARKAQAVLLANQGDYSASEDILTDLLEQRSLLARDESTRLDALALLAHVYSQTQRPEQAREAARTVIDQTADDEAETLRLVRFEALMSLAQAYLAMSEYALSEQTYIQLEDEARAWAAPQARRHLASALNGRAITYLERQQHERAQPLLRESIQLTEERMGTGSPLTIFTRTNLASSLRQTGQLQASRAEVERALDTAREHFGSESRIYIQISYNLGNLLREMGETREALELHRWTIEAARISFDHNDPIHSIFLTGLGQTELAAGHDPRAAEALELAATGLSEAFGPSHRRTLEAAEYLVKALDNLDRRDEARHWQDHLSRHGASVAN